MNIVEIDITKLKFADYNPRIITKEEFEGLKSSIESFDFVDPIIVNKDYTIIGGHQRARVAKELGFKTVPCNVLDLDKKTEKKLNVVLNSQAISGKYDDLLLSEILEELKLDDDYLSLRLDQLEPLDLSEPEEDDDFDPEPPVNPITVLGDLYELNGHRVLCGDSTDNDSVQKLLNDRFFDLVVTDPPYNVDYSAKNNALSKYRPNKNVHVDIANDNMSDEKFYSFLLDVYTQLQLSMKEGASIYVFHADIEGHNFRRAFLDAGLKLSQCLIWKKQHMVLSRQDYHWQHEPILYGWKEGAGHQWYSDRTQTTILEFDKPMSSKEHPTMKPLNIITYLIKNNSKGRDLIGDFFLGSGSTLIASEQTNRICYGMELEPKYCDVIVKRWVSYMKDKGEEFLVKRNGKEIDFSVFFNEEETINGKKEK